MQEVTFTPEQYKEIGRKIALASEPRYRIVPLNSLKHPKYRLRAPVHILLEIEGDQVIASLDDIEAFAYAETESEAINGLTEEIVQIYEDLKKDRESLGPLPLKWWEYLKEIVECR